MTAGSRRSGRYLVTVADDFGRSTSINSAVAEAFREGVLTSASIMAGGDAFEHAVETARGLKGISLGLHVTLCDGRAVSTPSLIPDLADPSGNFEKDPVKAWMKYSGRAALSQLQSEVEAQFDRLESAGVRPSHVDSHHHIHMKPSVFEIVCKAASRRGVEWVRIPREPYKIMFATRAGSRGFMPYVEWAVFGLVGVRNERTARRYGLKSARYACGLARTGGIDEEYFLYVLERLRPPLFEVFVHPDHSTGAGLRECGALTSAKVRERLASQNISVVGYAGISGGEIITGPAREVS